MRLPQLEVRRIRGFMVGLALGLGIVSIVSGQSQEPKPQLPATPVLPAETTDAIAPTTGVAGNAWRGPTWGVSVTWDPDEWRVEDEFLTRGFDGLRIGTDGSSVFIEAYDGFDGDPELCLAAAAQEIRERDREHTIEVAPLTGPPVPTAPTPDSARQLYGVTVTLEDGSPARAVEFVECRTLVPGTAVLELTWQTSTEAFNEELPKAEALFATVQAPAVEDGGGTPSASTEATPEAMATPVG